MPVGTFLCLIVNLNNEWLALFSDKNNIFAPLTIHCLTQITVYQSHIQIASARNFLKKAESKASHRMPLKAYRSQLHPVSAS